MTWLFTRSEGLHWFVMSVRCSTIRAASRISSTFTDEKLPWTATPAKHSFATLPSLEQFEEPIQEYRATGG